MTNTTSGSLHRHMPEPVVWLPQGLTLLNVAHQNGTNTTTFAHVLNVPVTKVIWPGEAVNLFPQWFFAVSPDTGMLAYQGEIHEHMRCETLRLCSGKFSATDYMEDELNFYCELWGAYSNSFGDRSDDEDELLLTEALEDNKTNWDT